MMRRMMVLFALVVGLAIAEKAAAAETWTDCVPMGVATFSNRVHVRCSAAVGGGILYFAMQTTDSAAAARFVSVASSALIAGRTLKIQYDPADLTGGTFGCATGDCRRARALEIL